MNCKPDDLAFIIAPYLDVPMRGLPVRVVRLYSSRAFVKAKNGDRSHTNGGRDCWLVDGNDARLPIVIADEYLRPMRDPGEDAIDESLLTIRIPEFDTV